MSSVKSSNNPTTASSTTATTTNNINFALVPKSSRIGYSRRSLTDSGSAVTIEDAASSSATSSNSFITSIYEHYATVYPNSELQQEYHNRDQLVRALMAADHAAKIQQQAEASSTQGGTEVGASRGRKRKGFFQRLFGSRGGNENDPDDDDDIDKSNNDVSNMIDNRLRYNDITTHEDDCHNSDDDWVLCGTKASLDVRAIPFEAHSVVRYHLASTYQQEQQKRQKQLHNNSGTVTNDENSITVARTSFEIAGTCCLVVTGLGEFIEIRPTNDTPKMKQDVPSALVQYTSDREALLGQQQQLQQEHMGNVESFRIDYTRAALIGPNFLMVSWGFTTTSRNKVILYRRLIVPATTPSNTDDEQDGVITWQAVGWIGPTVSVQNLNNDDDVFAATTDDGDVNNNSTSQLLNITDVIPIVVRRGDGITPAASVAISRLGGFIELIPIPPLVWYGPEMVPPPPRKNSRKRKEKYDYLNELQNLATAIHPKLMSVITTSDYHNDVIGMDILNTIAAVKKSVRRSENEKNDLPAEHILVAHGARMTNNHDGSGNPSSQQESISFWSIHTIFDDTIEGIGFSLQIRIEEALGLGMMMGPSKTIFATPTIMQYWRKPRQVELRDESMKYGDDQLNNDNNLQQEHEQQLHANQRITTISISVPIVSAKFVTSSRTGSVRAALLDANGGATILDCDLLVRSVTQTLTDEDVALLSKQNHDTNGDEPAEDVVMVPLVEIVYSRSHVLPQLSAQSSDLSQRIQERKQPTGVCPLSSVRIIDLHWLKHVTTTTTNTNDLALVALVKGEAVASPPILRILIDDFNAGEPSSPPLVVETLCPRNVSSTAFLRFMNSNLLYLALRSSVRSRNFANNRANMHTNLLLCALQEVRPRDMIQSLATSNKFKEAVQMYNTQKNSISVDDSEIQNLIEHCKRRLWETDLDLMGLESVDDDSYVVEQVSSMISLPTTSTPTHKIVEKNDIMLFRAAFQIVLKRFPAVPGVAPKTQFARTTVRDCLIRLGTYLILCSKLDTKPYLDHFIREFLPVGIADIAIGFAKKSMIHPLSILFYRHPIETVGNILILNSIPLSVSPTKYQHLLPVASNSDSMAETESAFFMCGVRKQEDDFASPRLMECDEYPKYLKRRFEMDVFLDENDRNILLSEGQERSYASGVAAADLMKWYCDRTRLIRQFVPTLDHTYIFARLSLCALRVKDTGALLESASSFDDSVRELHLSVTITEILRKISKDSVGKSFPVDPLSSITVENFDAMKAVDLISAIMDCRIGAVDVGIRWNRYLLPLMRLKMTIDGTAETELASALVLYCSNTIRRFVTKDEIRRDSGRLGLTNAVDVCCQIAYKSRTSIPNSERLLRNTRDTINFILTTIESIEDTFVKIMLSVDDCRKIVELLWKMYEALPMSLPNELGLEGEGTKMMLSRMDQTYHGLVILDIVSRWPNPDGTPIICTPKVLRRNGELKQRRDSIVSKICDSFCAQVGRQQPWNNEKEAIELMVSLLADVKELNHRIGEDDQRPLKTALVEHLVKPLLQQRQIKLVGEFLGKGTPEYVDETVVSDEVLLYFNEVVYGTGNQGDESDKLRPAIDCQEILGRYLPVLRQEFQYIRKFVDAAHFINANLFAKEVDNHVRPAELRKAFPFDVVESVLAKKPETITVDSEEWTDPLWAADANKKIRNHFASKSKRIPDQHETQAVIDLPSIPGQAIYHLAQLLGLSNVQSDIAVKTRVVHYLLAKALYGAAAAVSRALITVMSAAKTNIGEALNLFATLVSHRDYEDTDTRTELCRSVLTQITGTLSIGMCDSLDQMSKILIQLDDQRQMKHPRLKVPFWGIGKFFADTKAEYGVDLADRFTTLQRQCADCVVDDALLNDLGRYAMFYCIARSTRPTVNGAGSLDKLETQAIAALASCLILLMHSNTMSDASFQDLTNIFEDQMKLAVDKFPPFKWQNPNPEIVKRLINRGYSEWGARRAAAKSNNAGYDAAVQWAVTHSLDPDFDYPLVGVAKRGELLVDHDTIGLLSAVVRLVNEILSGKRNLGAFLESLGLKQKEITTPIRTRRSRNLPGSMSSELKSTGRNGHNKVVQTNSAVKMREFLKSPTPSKAQVGGTNLTGSLQHKLVILISTNAFNRIVTSRQERAFTTLQAHKIEYETLDAADPAYRELRDELVTISGMRGKYPQFFLVDLSNGDATFWGDWERFELSNDDGNLVREFSHKVSAPPLDSCSAKQENPEHRSTKFVTQELPIIGTNNRVDSKDGVMETNQSPLRSGNVYVRSPKDDQSSLQPFLKMSASAITPRNLSSLTSRNEKEILSGSKYLTAESPAKSRSRAPLIINKDKPLAVQTEERPPPAGPGSPERIALLHAGQKAFAIVRKRNSPSEAERKRLIEEGRRLLQKQKRESSAGSAASVSAPSSAASLDEVFPPPSSRSNTVAVVGRNSAPPSYANDTAICAADPAPPQADSGWDFDEDDDMSL